MLSAYAPAAVVIDEAMHVEQFRGHTEVYLEHTVDRSTRNFLQLVRPDMVADLRTTIDRAIKRNKPARNGRSLPSMGKRAR